MATLVKIQNQRNKVIIGTKIKIASSFLARLKGLMFTNNLNKDEGLLITPCNSIHTCFMHYPIDAVFIDDTHKIVALYENLSPWIGFTKIHFRAASVIELPAGSCKEFDLKEKDSLTLEYLQ